MRVTVYHNIARDFDGRPVNFFGYRPRHPLVPVFAYDVRTHWRRPLRVAEEAFEMFNVDPDLLTGRKRDIAAQYRARRLRSLSVGDIVRVGETAFACESFGFSVVDGDLNTVRVCEPGTHPDPDA